MRPDRVAENIAEGGIGHGKRVDAFFQQNSSGRIIAPLGVVRAAVAHRDVIQQHAARMVHENRESGHVREIHMIHGQALALFNENAVVREESGEIFVGRRHRQRLFQRAAIAVNRKIAERDVAAAVTA